MRTQDFVIGAVIRLTGTEYFRFTNANIGDLIERGLHELDAAARADLLAPIGSQVGFLGAQAQR